MPGKMNLFEEAMNAASHRQEDYQNSVLQHLVSIDSSLEQLVAILQDFDRHSDSLDVLNHLCVKAIFE